MGQPEENNAETLMHSCLMYLVTNLESWCCQLPDSGFYVLRSGLTLPPEICEALLQTAIKDSGTRIGDAFFHIFKDTRTSSLKRVCVRASGVTDCSLGWLLEHRPLELDISRCASLTVTARRHVNENSRRLQTLLIGDTAQAFFSDGTEADEEEDNDDDEGDTPVDPPPNCPGDPLGVSAMEEGRKGSNSSLPQLTAPPAATPAASTTALTAVSAMASASILTYPALRAFSAHGLWGERQRAAAIQVTQLISPLTGLTYLDLSSCENIHVSDMFYLSNISHLVSLILYAVPLGNIDMAFQHIKTLKALRVLDLGQGRDAPVEYDNPERNLVELVAALPHLDRLDLSGTNLPGDGYQSNRSKLSEEGSGCDGPGGILGLYGRYFDFLGLLGCANDACTRSNLPAKQVTGNANETQVLLSIQQYVEKPELLVQALNHLFQIFRFSVCSDQRAALQVILSAMRRHPRDKHIQISGSASLFYIVKGEEKYNLSYKTKRRTISAILDGMENHTDEATMMRNGCLTLCHFKIPQDVLFEYRRMVMILLRMVAPRDQEEFVQRIGIYLLNSLSCQVDGKDKQLVGDLGAISTMLNIIQHKLDHGVCDEVMEIAWSTMWNVTDETAINCERFIQEAGMELFLQCLERFPAKPELLRNMMGLMGNVAEVAHLRPRLRQTQYVQLFCDLLDSESDGIEVSYNACGVLAHMVSDGATAWLLEDPPRTTILARMVHAITRWNLKTKRNINYRSFEPILRLLHEYETPECQHWAVWALCNLTTMYPQKYYSLLEKEGGIAIISELAQDPRPYPEITLLAQRVVTMCEQLRADPENVLGGAEADWEVEGGSDQEAMDG